MHLPAFKLERFFARHEFSAPYLLSSSDCESFSVAEILELRDGTDRELQKLGLGYTESPGHPALREAITELYRTVAADNVLVHAGAEEAIFAFMHVILQPGDHLIVHWPAYQSLHQIATSLGCEVTKWQAHEQNGWALEVDWLAGAIRKNTRAIVLNCPHNPTGYLMPEKQFRQVVELARSHNLYLFSDEVYRFLEYDAQKRLPAACDLYHKAISLGVMSKAFGLAGLRIGWLATHDHELLEKLLAFKDYTTICNSAPSEFLATIALQHRDAVLARNLAIIRKNLDLLDAFFERHQSRFSWRKPSAGCIAFPKLILQKDVSAFCEHVVANCGVLLLPSPVYDYGRRHFRIGFGRKNMPEALDAFEDYLKEHLLL